MAMQSECRPTLHYITAHITNQGHRAVAVNITSRGADGGKTAWMVEMDEEDEDAPAISHASSSDASALEEAYSRIATGH